VTEPPGRVPARGFRNRRTNPHRSRAQDRMEFAWEIRGHDTYPVCFLIRNPVGRDNEKDQGRHGYCNNFSCLALTLAAGVGPGARRAIRRPSTRSSPATNSAVPTGRPVLSARRRAANASSRPSRSKSAKQDTRSSTGRTVANPSSFPAEWARTLDHAQSAAYPTRPARTGFRLT
jgi:hypothetical protein